MCPSCVFFLRQHHGNAQKTTWNTVIVLNSLFDTIFDTARIDFYWEPSVIALAFNERKSSWHSNWFGLPFVISSAGFFSRPLSICHSYVFDLCLEIFYRPAFIDYIGGYFNQRLNKTLYFSLSFRAQILRKMSLKLRPWKRRNPIWAHSPYADARRRGKEE